MTTNENRSARDSESPGDQNVDASREPAPNAMGQPEVFESVESEPVYQPVLTEGAKPEALGTGTASSEKISGAAEEISRRLMPVIPQIELENVAANGGAVAAVVLGVWALLGSFLTPWSGISAVFGMVLGIWGISSPKRKMSYVGIAICLVAMIFCSVEISHITGEFFNFKTVSDPGF